MDRKGGGGQPQAGPKDQSPSNTGRRLATNAFLGDGYSGDAFVQICYAVDGSCSGMGDSCTTVPVVVDCGGWNLTLRRTTS